MRSKNGHTVHRYTVTTIISEFPYEKKAIADAFMTAPWPVSVKWSPILTPRTRFGVRSKLCIQTNI